MPHQCARVASPSLHLTSNVVSVAAASAITHSLASSKMEAISHQQGLHQVVEHWNQTCLYKALLHHYALATNPCRMLLQGAQGCLHLQGTLQKHPCFCHRALGKPALSSANHAVTPVVQFSSQEHHPPLTHSLNKNMPGSQCPQVAEPSELICWLCTLTYTCIAQQGPPDLLLCFSPCTLHLHSPLTTCLLVSTTSALHQSMALHKTQAHTDHSYCLTTKLQPHMHINQQQKAASTVA